MNHSREGRQDRISFQTTHIQLKKSEDLELRPITEVQACIGESQGMDIDLSQGYLFCPTSGASVRNTHISSLAMNHRLQGHLHAAGLWREKNITWGTKKLCAYLENVGC